MSCLIAYDPDDGGADPRLCAGPPTRPTSGLAKELQKQETSGAGPCPAKVF